LTFSTKEEPPWWPNG